MLFNKLMHVSHKKKSGSVPVYLNVYDLTPINGYAYWLGLGVYHSGVQVHGVEYAFGGHDRNATGVFEGKPKHCPGFTFRKSIFIGTTDLGPKEVQAFMVKVSEEYYGNTYNLIQRNCNHFCEDVCLRLTGKVVPPWINRLARLGFLCNCVLPASINDVKVGQDKSVRNHHEGEKKKTRNQVNKYNASSNLPLSSRVQNQCLPPSASIVNPSSALAV